MTTKQYRRTNQAFSKKGESNFSISQTVPNLAPTARELLKRHAQGLTDNAQFEGQYSGDLPDYRGMEPFELDRLMYETQQTVKDLEQQRNYNAIALRDAQLKQKAENDKKTYLKLKAEYDGK